jgi:hypothetical protein
MTGLTRSLEVLVLAASAFPMQIAGLPAMVGGGRSPRGRGFGLWIVPAAVWLTAVLALVVSPHEIDVVGADPLVWSAIALAAGIAALAVELLVGGTWSWAATGTRPVGVRMAEDVPGAGAPLALSTAVTGVGEELLFRGVWLAVLLDGFGWPALAATGVAAGVYAANHAYLGPDIVVQKLCSGCIFTVLAAAGGGVLAAAVAHVMENVLIAFLPRLQAWTWSPAS